MPKLTLSKSAINKSIMAFEISWSEKAGFSVYEKKYSKPVVPDPLNTSSGVTIGAGYDCGQFSAAKIRQDWSSVLPKSMVDSLVKTAGLKKMDAVRALPLVRNVNVPVDAMLQVFYNNTLFEVGRQALRIYPDLPNIHPVEQTVICGIVYNRGAALDGDRRREMRALIAQIKRDDDRAMADSIRSMCRLWPSTLGLRIRRNVEADLVALPDTPLPASDILVLDI